MRFKAFLFLLLSALYCLGQPGPNFTARDLPYMAPRGGESLLAGLQAAFNFNEPFFGPTNRFSSFSATSTQVLTNSGALTGSARSLSGGGVEITNSGAGILVVTNASMFSLNSSFTMAFWVIGANSGSGNCIVGQGVNRTDPHFDWIWDTQNFVTRDAGNNAHSVSGTVINSGAWILVVCGYDAANNQIFISNNGGARVNASAGGSMRQTANMPFTIAVNPAIFDNFFFWNRVLTTAEITRLYNSGSPIEYPFADKRQLMAILNSYTFGVTNLGGTITAYEVGAVSNLVSTIVTNSGTWAKFSLMMPFVTNSLQAALSSLVPYYHISPGNDSIQQLIYPGSASALVGFTAGDLGPKGLTGDGSTKYLQGISALGAGLEPSLRTLVPTPNNGGFVLYLSTLGIVPGANKVEFGWTDNTAANMYFVWWADAYGVRPNAAWIGANTAGGFVTNTVGTNAGYFSIQRSSTTDIEEWSGYSGKGHFGTKTNTVSVDNTAWGTSAFTVGWFGQYDRGSGGVVAATLSTNSMGFTAFCSTALTFAEDAIVYNAVQAFRQAMGFVAGSITTQPTNGVVLTGNSKTLAVVAGNSPTAYQWSKNGVNIGGATQSSYTIASASASDWGNYNCRVTYANGENEISATAAVPVVTTTTVSNWVVQVVVNGGAWVSSNTIYAVNNYWDGMIADSLDSKVYVVNCYVPDNLTAALTPLVSGPGNVLWVNHAFVSGDLTINGLTGNGSTKYLDTGFNPSTGIVSADDCGLSLYSYTTAGGTVRSVGAYVIGSPGNGFLLDAKASDISGGTANGEIGQDAVSVAATSQGPGFYAINRTGNTDSRFYFASSGSAFAQLGSTMTTARTGTFPNGNVNDFSLNIPGFSSNFDPCSDTHSYTSIHKGFDSPNQQKEYNRVQTLRTTLGGGFR